MENGGGWNLEEYVNFELLSSIFETIRMVDPEKKRVLYFKKGSHQELEEVCYGFWARGAACENSRSNL